MNELSNKPSAGLFTAFLAFGLKNNFTSQCVSLKTDKPCFVSAELRMMTFTNCYNVGDKGRTH